jgi:hypothetical protein
MVNVRILEMPLSGPSSRILGDNDPALDQVLSLAEHSQYVAAAELAEKLWQEQVYDVRSIGVFLLGAFVEQGMGALPDILSAILAVLTKQWEWMSPTTGKYKQFDVGLRWLVTGILGQFRFAQKVKSPQWAKWLSQWDQTNQKQTFERLQGLLAVLDSVLAGSLCKGSFLQLQKTLRELSTTHGEKQSDIKQASAVSTAVASSEQIIDVELLNTGELNMKQLQESANESGAAVGANSMKTATLPSALPSITITLSPPMHALMRKIGVFNRLVRLGRFKQAAIVYKDIKDHIEKFDPRIYLPSVFGEYFSNIVTHAEKLLPSLDTKDDFATRALIDLYQIDLELFIAATG